MRARIASLKATIDSDRARAHQQHVEKVVEIRHVQDLAEVRRGARRGGAWRPGSPVEPSGWPGSLAGGPRSRSPT